jgi:hypothetical protein
MTQRNAIETMPEDLRQAYETFVLLCTHYKVTFAGMAFRAEPPSMYALGNVTERGHDLAELFRLYAEVVDRKTDKGQIQDTQTPASRIN